MTVNRLKTKWTLVSLRYLWEEIPKSELQMQSMTPPRLEAAPQPQPKPKPEPQLQSEQNAEKKSKWSLFRSIKRESKSCGDKQGSSSLTARDSDTQSTDALTSMVPLLDKASVSMNTMSIEQQEADDLSVISDEDNACLECTDRCIELTESTCMCCMVFGEICMICATIC